MNSENEEKETKKAHNHCLYLMTLSGDSL